ncbi:MAG: nucleotidyltransferase domain-containing protein [Tannerella sp.]|jgi:predicted nucleotidyltransferase|nr:nucleotidyltransferase domain-containing protein [Tannerella sp.]
MHTTYARNGGIAMLDKETVITTANRYADEVKKQYNPFAVVLFGSYVNGNPHKDSDIDVAIVFNDYNGDWYDTAVDLWRISEKVSLDIEPHLMDTTKDPSGFTDYVLRNGNIIYQSDIVQ